MAEITRIDLWQALDSRGTPTVAARVHIGSHAAMAIAPSGASTGSHEALFLRDGKTSFDGLGVTDAIATFTKEVVPALIGITGNDFFELDRTLRSFDSTPTQSRYGGHIPVAITLATWLAYAKRANVQPYEVIAQHVGAKSSLPMPMVNIFSGGAHAGRAIDLQDILAIPTLASTFQEGLEWIWKIREEAKKILAKKGFDVSLVADEGGLTGKLSGDEEAIALVADAIENAKLTGKAHIALDIAASQLFDGKNYVVHESGAEVRLDSTSFVARWRGWITEYPIISVEDGAAEDDEEGWSEQSQLTSQVQVLGDDRYATQLNRLRLGIGKSQANSILIKPNQAGTLFAALSTLKEAKAHRWNTVVSARSGDTEESWLADLATGSGAGQIKVGSTHRSERTSKWNRLLELSHDRVAPFNTERALNRFI
ncbi:MAG: phosphopyruvate hydratase [Actinomycetota bacterium]